jgi:hypothetical protein
VLPATTRSSTFKLVLSAAARGGLRKAELSVDGKLAKRFSKPRGNVALVVAPALLRPGRHVLTAVLTPLRGAAKRLSLPFLIGNCAPASLTLSVARANARSAPSLRLTFKSGGPALAKASFVLPAKLRAQVGRRSAGASVGTLRLTVAGRARKVTLKVPKRAKSRGKVTLAQGVTLRQGAAPRLDVVLPAGTTAIDIALASGRTSLLAGTRACPSGATTARVSGSGGSAVSLRAIPVVRCRS